MLSRNIFLRTSHHLMLQKNITDSLTAVRMKERRKSWWGLHHPINLKIHEDEQHWEAILAPSNEIQAETVHAFTSSLDEKVVQVI